MDNTVTAWTTIKDIGIVINYLLVPIAVVLFKGFNYLQRMDRRILKLEILHKLRGCHANGLEELED